VKAAVIDRIVLIGMMGSGKTSVGQALSRRTGWPFVDNDVVLRGISGATARELAARSEEELRAAERQALADALAVPPPSIVSAAGGAVLEPSAAEWLAGSFVVWLRATPTVLAGRVGGEDHRPWLDGDALAWLSHADATRATAYGALASVTVDTDALVPDQIAAVILEALAASRESATIGP
jgi:shikimate kinase